MGFALGVVGLRLDDFCGLSPSEFSAVCEAHHTRREDVSREDWERMRLHATITVQPHSRKRLNARQLLPFPWETQRTTAPTISKEEALARFKRLTAQSAERSADK